MGSLAGLRRRLSCTRLRPIHRRHCGFRAILRSRSRELFPEKPIGRRCSSRVRPSRWRQQNKVNEIAVRDRQLGDLLRSNYLAVLDLSLSTPVGVAELRLVLSWRGPGVGSAGGRLPPPGKWRFVCGKPLSACGDFVLPCGQARNRDQPKFAGSAAPDHASIYVSNRHTGLGDHAAQPDPLPLHSQWRTAGLPRVRTTRQTAQVAQAKDEHGAG